MLSKPQEVKGLHLLKGITVPPRRWVPPACPAPNTTVRSLHSPCTNQYVLWALRLHAAQARARTLQHHDALMTSASIDWSIAATHVPQPLQDLLCAGPH